MRKSILAIAAIAATLGSCSNNGEKVEASEAKEVVVDNSQKAIAYNKISTESNIDWRASHLGGAQPRFGNISVKSAEFVANDNKISNATVIMDMSSINVTSFPEGNENTAKLKGHLQSADFFNVESYPTSTFELTSVESAEGDFNSVVTGNLTIMDVTKSISFNANVDVSDNTISMKSEDFAVNRADWNLTYNAEGTEGVPVDYLIANDIGFTIDVSLSI